MTGQPVLTCDEVRDLAPLYVAGALDADEMVAIREHLAGCDDPHAELDELGEAASALLETVEPVEPPTRLKARLMAAAAADLAEGRHPASVAVETAPSPIVVPVGNAIDGPSGGPDSGRPSSGTGTGSTIPLDQERARRRPRLGWLLAAAAVVAIVVLGGWNVLLQRDLGVATTYRDGVNAALQVAGQPGSVTALLTADDGSVSGLGVVAADGTVHLAMRGLPGTSGSQVYTAWSIGSDGTPVALGDFTVGADGVAVATTHGPAPVPGATLALTLEPVPGATAPAGPIVAKGVTVGHAG